MASQPSNRTSLWGGIAAVIIAIAVLGTGYSQNWWQASSTTATPTPSASATPAESLTYQGVDGQDALTVLKGIATVETSDTSFGPMVKTINGRTAGTGEYWQFFVNGESSMVGAHTYTSKSSDTLEWRITSF
jgi:hypothetical protein